MKLSALLLEGTSPRRVQQRESIPTKPKPNRQLRNLLEGSIASGEPITLSVSEARMVLRLVESDREGPFREGSFSVSDLKSLGVKTSGFQGHAGNIGGRPDADEDRDETDEIDEIDPSDALNTQPDVGDAFPPTIDGDELDDALAAFDQETTALPDPDVQVNADEIALRIINGGTEDEEDDDTPVNTMLPSGSDEMVESIVRIAQKSRQQKKAQTP